MNQDQKEMKFIAETINETFFNYDVDVIVSKGVRSLTTDTFRCAFKKGTKFSKVKGLEEELALSLGVRKVRIAKDANGIFVEVGREVTTETRLEQVVEKIEPLPPYCALIGIDTDGAPLALRLSSSEVAHILIAGTTGSGKTALTRAMLVSLAYFNNPNELEIVLIDPKGRGFKPLESLPHVKESVIDNPMAGAQKMQDLVEEMERRDREDISEPKIVVAIDELADLLMTAGDEFRTPLTRLCQRGRQSGIHVIACTQKPTAQIMGGLAKSNFPIRLVGAVASKNEASIASGISGSGAELLSGKGDFLIVNSGEVKRFNALWLDAEGYSKLGGGGKDGKKTKRRKK